MAANYLHGVETLEGGKRGAPGQHGQVCGDWSGGDGTRGRR